MSKPRNAGVARPRSRARLCLVAATALGPAGCGLPALQDLKTDYTKNVRKLGVTPVYPLRETIRMGQLWITDGSGTNPGVGGQAEVPSSLLISEDLVAPMEAARKARMVSVGRFGKSDANIATALFGSATGTTYYRQPENETLEIAAFPKYTLSAVDQAGLSGVVPQALASFFASLGFVRSQYLTVEAVGTEIAELPLDTYGGVVLEACNGGKGVWGNRPAGDGIQTRAFNILNAWWAKRNTGTPLKPQLTLIRRVFYLRGIRYVYHDDRAVAAALGAAFTNRFASGVTPPTPPAPPLPAVGAANPDKTTSQAQLAALSQQIADLQKAIVTSNNTNISGSFARATAQGVEMVDLFERPVAFGFEPLSEPLDVRRGTDGAAVFPAGQNGIDEFCRDFGAIR